LIAEFPRASFFPERPSAPAAGRFAFLGIVDFATSLRYPRTVMKLVPLCYLLLATWAGAAEPVQLPLDVGTLKMRDGKVYEGVKIVGQDAVGVKITHAGGTARLPFVRLPKDLTDRFTRDHAAAREQLEKEARAAATHGKAVDKAVAKQESEDETEPPTAVEGMPDPKGDPTAKIAALRGYIERLESGIENARAEAVHAQERANSYRAAAYTQVATTTETSVIYQNRTNQSKLRRAEFQERRARNLDERIREANSLIEGARTKIRTLEKS